MDGTVARTYYRTRNTSLRSGRWLFSHRVSSLPPMSSWHQQQRRGRVWPLSLVHHHLCLHGLECAHTDCTARRKDLRVASSPTRLSSHKNARGRKRSGIALKGYFSLLRSLTLLEKGFFSCSLRRLRANERSAHSKARLARAALTKRNKRSPSSSSCSSSFLENQGKRRDGRTFLSFLLFWRWRHHCQKGTAGGEREEGGSHVWAREKVGERERRRPFWKRGGAEGPGGAGRGKSLPQIAGRPPHSPALYVLYSP